MLVCACANRLLAASKTAGCSGKRPPTIIVCLAAEAAERGEALAAAPATDPTHGDWMLLAQPVIHHRAHLEPRQAVMLTNSGPYAHPQVAEEGVAATDDQPAQAGSEADQESTHSHRWGCGGYGSVASATSVAVRGHGRNRVPGPAR